LKLAVAASLALTSATAPAAANELGAALVGGIFGGVIMNEANKNKRRTSNSAGYSAARQQNREVQTSLNYFGFPAGVADGVMGAKSRSAAAQYQAYLGYPATGKLTAYERDFLVSSFSRAQIGGPQVIKAMQGPEGTRGLLRTWRDEAAGVRSASSGGYGYGGLPVEVSGAIDEIASSTEPSAEQLMQRSGFMHLADINGDGKNDYLIDTSVSGSSFWCGPSHCAVMVFASTPQGYSRNDFQARDVTMASFSCHQGTCRMNDQGSVLAAVPAPAPAPAAPAGGTVLASAASQPQAAAQPLGGIQLFAAPAAGAPAPSLASYCSKVSLLTSSNGGYATAASMTDPELALGEQFCLARSYAINEGEARVAKLQGVSQEQVDSQCDAFGPAVQPFLAKLGSQGSGAVLADVQKFVLQSNMSLDQLSNTAAICLFSGYRRDNLDVALGAALLLTGTGQRPYGELVGHHLAQGFGAKASAPRAQDWFAVAVSAIEGGSQPVFAPGQPERTSLIKAAAADLDGAAQPQPVPAASSAAALPVFGSN
jgi:hypothetical protein